MCECNVEQDGVFQVPVQSQIADQLFIGLVEFKLKPEQRKHQMSNIKKHEGDKDGQIKIFLVDDDSVFLKSLEIEFLKKADFDIETFNSGEHCLANLSHKPDIIILDYHLNSIDMDAMNGIDVLDEIKSKRINIQVIMLSSQDKINVAVNCIHHKAFDYVVKSETAFLRLQNIITKIFKYQKLEKQLNWYIEKI